MTQDEFKISYVNNETSTRSGLEDMLYYEELESIKISSNNSIIFHTMYIFDTGENLEVRLLIINASEQCVSFGKLNLSLLNINNKSIASSVVDFSCIGKIEPKRFTPFTVFFKRPTSNNFEISNDCKVVINNENVLAKLAHKITVDYIDDRLALYEKRMVENYVANIPPIEEDYINISHYKSGVDYNNETYVIIVLGSNVKEEVEIDNIKIRFRNTFGMLDAYKEVEGPFKIKPQTASVYKIIIENKDIIRESFNIENSDVLLDILG